MPLRWAATACAGTLAAYGLYCALFPDHTRVELGEREQLSRQFGALRVRWNPPPGVDLATLQQRAMWRADGTSEPASDPDHRSFAEYLEARRDGANVVFEMPIDDERWARHAVTRMTRGALELREVVDDNTIDDLVALGIACDDRDDSLAVCEPQIEGAIAEPVIQQQWKRVPEEVAWPAERHLRARTRGVLIAAYGAAARRGWHPPAGTHVAYQHVTPGEGATDRAAYVRALLVRDELALPAGSITRVGYVNGYAWAPSLNVDFDRTGGERLAALAAGTQLAIIVDGDVHATALIVEPVRDGRAAIYPAGERSDQFRESDELDVPFRVYTPPLGGTLASWTYDPPIHDGDDATSPNVARAVLVIAGALAAAALAWRALRPPRIPRARARS